MSNDNNSNVPKRCRDLSGQTFGRLKVIRFSHIGKYGNAHWICSCECGSGEKSYRSGNIVNGKTQSCGCLLIEKITSHGMHDTHEYRCWHMMIQRCYNKNFAKYEKYGKIGIYVYEEWKNSFEAFIRDMKMAPSSKHTLDRFPDKKGNYVPNNVRWATPAEQQGNRDSNIDITIDGVKKCAAHWGEIYGISKGAIYHRIKKLKWNPVDAVIIPQTRKRSINTEININGISKNAKEWCKVMNINYKTFASRVAYGWSPIDALMTPVGEKLNGQE